jgi:tight adherence protein C
MDLLAPVSSALVAASLALCGLAATAGSARRRAVLRALGEDRLRSETVALWRPQRWPVRFVAWIGSTRLARGLCRFDRIGRRYDLAGRPLTPETIIGIKFLVPVICGSLGFVAGFPLGVAALLATALSCATARVPDIALARMASRRQAQIADRVPDLVELLVATTEAGLTPMIAFRRSVNVVSGPLGEELCEAGRQIDLGASWRNATELLAERTDIPSLRRLSMALTRSQRLGTTVGSALRSLADDLRSERRARAEELARRAPVKMLFPLVFLILPAFLLLTVGPVVLATVRSLR